VDITSYFTDIYRPLFFYILLATGGTPVCETSIVSSEVSLLDYYSAVCYVNENLYFTRQANNSWNP